VIERNIQIIVTLIASAVSAAAQGVAPTPSLQAADASSIIFAPKPPVSEPEPTPGKGTDRRPVSTEITAEISLGLPAYSPEILAPSGGSPTADLRDIDRPKNQIPRLPVSLMKKYVVRESRLPVFRTRDLYTKAGLIDLAFKEHPGLRIGNFFNLNAKVAYEIIIEEQLYAARQDLVDTVLAVAAAGDAEEVGVMQRAIIDESMMSWWPQRPGKN